MKKIQLNQNAARAFLDAIHQFTLCTRYRSDFLTKFPELFRSSEELDKGIEEILETIPNTANEGEWDLTNISLPRDFVTKILHPILLVILDEQIEMNRLSKELKDSFSDEKGFEWYQRVLAQTLDTIPYYAETMSEEELDALTGGASDMRKVLSLGEPERAYKIREDLLDSIEDIAQNNEFDPIEALAEMIDELSDEDTSIQLPSTYQLKVADYLETGDNGDA